MPEQVAIVTGASMGLGLAVAQDFSKRGYRVVTCARSEVEVTWDWHLVLDVSDESHVRRLVNHTEEKFDRIDVLVCNAAVYGPIGRLEDIDADAWAETIAINLFGTMYCCREVLPIMREQGYGKIVTLSGGGAKPKPECTAYNASKAAVVRFTEALAVELEGSGIDINAVAPGVLDTRMRISSEPPEDPERAMEKAVELIAWLASPASDGISGRLFSAVWDDWWLGINGLTPDDYRMRRVVPA